MKKCNEWSETAALVAFRVIIKGKMDTANIKKPVTS